MAYLIFAFYYFKEKAGTCLPFTSDLFDSLFNINFRKKNILQKQYMAIHSFYGKHTLVPSYCIFLILF